MERTTKVFPLDDTPKALKNQGFSGKPFQSGHSFSSQARYDHFDTSPQYNYSVLGTGNTISSQARYDHFDTSLFFSIKSYIRDQDLFENRRNDSYLTPNGQLQGKNAVKLSFDKTF